MCSPDAHGRALPGGVKDNLKTNGGVSINTWSQDGKEAFPGLTSCYSITSHFVLKMHWPASLEPHLYKRAAEANTFLLFHFNNMSLCSDGWAATLNYPSFCAHKTFWLLNMFATQQLLTVFSPIKCVLQVFSCRYWAGWWNESLQCNIWLQIYPKVRSWAHSLLPFELPPGNINPTTLWIVTWK